MKTIILVMVACNMILFNNEAHPELYTKTQTMIIPGMPCQLILISIYDDSGTPIDYSDDVHLRTDAFLRCGDSINEIKSNNETGESKLTEVMILPGNLRSFIQANSKSIKKADMSSYNYLIEISTLFDTCNPSKNECKDLFDKLSDVPDYFKPYMLNSSNKINFEDYIKQLELNKHD